MWLVSKREMSWIVEFRFVIDTRSFSTTGKGTPSPSQNDVAATARNLRRSGLRRRGPLSVGLLRIDDIAAPRVSLTINNKVPG